MFWFNKCDGKIQPVKKEYARGFSERCMSGILDKFKNGENGFCHVENMQFFVYMMDVLENL